MKKLMPDFSEVDQNTLENMLLVLAKTVKDSLLQAGATPAKDYTILDCYKLAQPFALEVFKREDRNITFSGG